MSKSVSEPIILDEPITRGDQKITQLTLRRPVSGELRGVSVLSIMQMQTEAIFTLLPRICEPVITPSEMNKLDPADLIQIGTTIAGFFVPKHMMMDKVETEQNGKILPS